MSLLFPQKTVYVLVILVDNMLLNMLYVLTFGLV